MTFTQSGYFLLFIPIAAYVLWYILKGWRTKPSMKVSTVAPFGKQTRSYKNYLVHLPFMLRVVTLSMLVLVLARPQSDDEWTEHAVEGIDIMLATDVSTSMLIEDMKPNRFEVAKEVALEFIDSRPNDNIGLTLFAGESFVQCPLTNSHGILKGMLKANDVNSIINRMDNGTAIGLGIATSVSRLVDSKAKSKVVILLTDGANNAGGITPLDAAEIAKESGVRVYTIAAATDIKEIRQNTPFGVITTPIEQVDEETLKGIAEITGGKYYRATDRQSLKEIYSDIDKLEKTRLQVSDYREYEEKFLPFAMVALAALLLELLLRLTILRRIP